MWNCTVGSLPILEYRTNCLSGFEKCSVKLCQKSDNATREIKRLDNDNKNTGSLLRPLDICTCNTLLWPWNTCTVKKTVFYKKKTFTEEGFFLLREQEMNHVNRNSIHSHHACLWLFMWKEETSKQDAVCSCNEEWACSKISKPLLFKCWRIVYVYIRCVHRNSKTQSTLFGKKPFSIFAMQLFIFSFWAMDHSLSVN